jgi:hypothetical protein
MALDRERVVTAQPQSGSALGVSVDDADYYGAAAGLNAR